MADPKPSSDRSKFSERPRTREADQGEWRTFSALPPTANAPLGIPEAKTETATQAQAVATGPKLATWRKRVGAFALDFGLGLGVSYLAQGVASLLGTGAETVNIVGYAAFFTAWLVNRGYYQSRPQGQSLGKWLLNIKTIDTETEQSPSIVRSVAREGVVSLLVLTESLVVPLGADALFAIFDKEKRQALHDRAGRTQVVEAEAGFHLDEKTAQLLQDLLDGETADDLKSALNDLMAQAKKNDTVADLSQQLSQVGKDLDQNTRSLRQQTGKQVRTWVDSVKKKMDNE
ncbi:MAG: RDD family protein [Synechococcaceae cyanobacterium SM2_3_1]|nr:RDD family protein [Synechococcaceae cyanobacterium SM2_3_1]